MAEEMVAQVTRRTLKEIGLHEMRPYQREAGRAVLASVYNGLGHAITIEIARQGGKNELSAQLELLLLGRFASRTRDAIKCAPTFMPQLRISMRRLWACIEQGGLAAAARKEANTIQLGRARLTFLSAEPGANVVGHTANLLLEVDEAQDIDPQKFDRDFRPMAATANTTTVYYGTAWDDTTLLERAKQANLEAERRDGIRRHFEYDWQTIARYVPAYGAYVENERRRLGDTHPVYLTQYCLKPVSGGGRLFTNAQRALLGGTHARLFAPAAGEEYVAGLDLAGSDASDGDLTPACLQGDSPIDHPSPPGGEGIGWGASAGIGAAGGRDDVQGALSSRRRRQPAAPSVGASATSRRDSTVLTIGRLVHPERGAIVQAPRIEIVEHYAWTGAPHETLLPGLIDLLRDVWRVRRVSVDATGLGETAARLISVALGSARVDQVKFTAGSKSEMGFDLLAAVNGGRLKIYRGDGSVEYREFARQADLARVTYRANQTMNFFVDPNDGHDDYVVSAALLVRAAKDIAPRAARGRVRV